MGTRCQLLVANTASTMCTNMLLKHHDTIVAKIKDNISFESFMDLQNLPLCDSLNLFPKEAIEKAIVKSSTDLHDEVIYKAVTLDKHLKKPQKRLHFSQ